MLIIPINGSTKQLVETLNNGPVEFEPELTYLMWEGPDEHTRIITESELYKFLDGKDVFTNKIFHLI